MSTGKVVLGTLAGIAIGSIAGILFAPEKGSKTRKQIMDKGTDYADDLLSKLDEFLNSLTEKIKRTKKDAEDLVEIAKAKYDDAKKDVKDASTTIKHEVASDMNRATT